MAASGDVTYSQDGVKLHPYVVALVRWCVSCVWSAATVMLHRLMASQLPPVTASKPAAPSKPPARPASSGHLHPEPLVTCQVLHQPTLPEQDLIFIHGLYGSLENTWRQGDWRSKYKLEPNKVPLKRSASIPNPCVCNECRSEQPSAKILKTDYTNNNLTFTQTEFFNKGSERVISNEDMLITEQFYNTTLLDQVQIVDNFEMQAQFVRELFQCENINEMYDESATESERTKASSKENAAYQCECNVCQNENEKLCPAGCGCVCDKCYSPCWPKDWLKVDFPNARVISINYTSDPYLWRPLWVKESKRLRLHERAEQMTSQLLDLGVGKRPIVWVGHSKGGLFIKQIYCEAYEAFLKTRGGKSDESTTNVCRTNHENNSMENANKNKTDQNQYGAEQNGGNVPNLENNNLPMNPQNVNAKNAEESSKYNAKERSSLWKHSSGFMFYSVPHRGSPLADIKTPITARSIELLEISKDNSLVLSLQERWLRATEPSKPVVRSLVETKRTLMAVLWLRIVSVESADAGIGALCGISLDHREICKPSSRSCILYKELLNLIHAAVDRWRWNPTLGETI